LVGPVVKKPVAGASTRELRKWWVPAGRILAAHLGSSSGGFSSSNNMLCTSPIRWASLLIVVSNVLQPIFSQVEVFTTELFLDNDELNAGLYEGEVKGRRRFGDSQVPHGSGTIYYFTNDKFNRVNYTGNWVDGQREGNGSTYFQDGARYIGGYTEGLESGAGKLLYQNGNSLDAEFVEGKIQGHGVFRYANGDQREGFFTDSSLEGQVIFTRSDGVTYIETWKDGEQVEGDGPTTPLSVQVNERSTERALGRRRRPPPSTTVRTSTPPPPPRSRSSTLPSLADRRPRGRGGGTSWSLSGQAGLRPRAEQESTVSQRLLGQSNGSADDDRKMHEEVGRVGEEARSSARRFLFHIFSTVNS